MTEADDIYKRGLSFLDQSPPNYIRALSLMKKAKRKYEHSGDLKNADSVEDKLQFICSKLAESDLAKATSYLHNLKFKDAVLKALDAYKHTILSNPKKPEKSTKKIMAFIEKVIIELLYDVESRIRKTEFSEEVLTETHFVERTIADIFLSDHLVGYSLSTNHTIPDDIVAQMSDKKKMQQALINVYETIALKARETASNLIKEGNINRGERLLDLAKDVYKRADSLEKINTLKPLLSLVYEAKGDTEFTQGQKLAEEGRLNKGRDHLKIARNYYNAAKNEKKADLAKENYLKFSVKMGENILEDAKKAESLGDLNMALEYLEEAFDFFQTINHKKYIALTEKNLTQIYEHMGDIEIEKAENLNAEKINEMMTQLQSQYPDEFTEISAETVNTELFTQKLQLYHDAYFYYQKAENASMVRKIERKIEKYTEDIAELLFEKARKNLKHNKFEQGYLNFKKCLYYYESIKRERKIKSVQEQIKKIIKKLDRTKLERLKSILNERDRIIAEKKLNKISSTILNDGTAISSQSEQFRCKACGTWVNRHYYDTIQEKCLNCREDFYCNECSKEIKENELYLECTVCKERFCLDCAERVYDYNQQKCASHRVVQVCQICNLESNINQDFAKCRKCLADFCPEHTKTHFDYNQELCYNCRVVNKCAECGTQIPDNEVNRCDSCHQYFCSQHFDFNRNQCYKCKKEEICAVCATVLPVLTTALKCKECGFFYCQNHYSNYHKKCNVCLGEAKCAECGKDLHEEQILKCSVCNKVYCSEDFVLNKKLCKNCNALKESEAVTISPINVSPINADNDLAENIASQSQPVPGEVTQETSNEENNLIYNTLKVIVDKFNNKEVLDQDQIAYIYKYQINLPKDPESYLNIGDTGDVMEIIRDENGKPYVAMVPEIPIEEGSKYYGNLIKKFIHYMPEVPETIDGMTCIMNLVFYAANNPNWDKYQNILKMTLLNPGITLINVLKSIYKKEDVKIIENNLLETSLRSAFGGFNIQDSLNFIRTNEDEDEVGVFSDNDNLDRILKAFYYLHNGNVIRASEIIAIFEI